MRVRRHLTPAQIELIKNYKSPKPPAAARFSKRQLKKMGLPYEGGGLVRINGKIYTFVSRDFNPYKSHILGEGAFGKAKLLVNIEDPEDLKVLKVLGASTKPPVSERERRSFEEELKMAEALGRGFRSMMTKAGKNGHTSYCGVIDLAPGQELAKYYFKENCRDTIDIDTKSFLTILLKCCEEVQKIHDKGYVHCDIKFENFVYDSKKGDVKVIDFGLVREPGIHNVKCGTPGYMAPEVLGEDSSKYDYKNDVFALGHMLEEYFRYTFLKKNCTSEIYEKFSKHEKGKFLESLDEKNFPLANINQSARDEGKQLLDLIKKITEKDPAARCDLKEAISQITSLKEHYQYDEKKIAVERETLQPYENVARNFTRALSLSLSVSQVDKRYKVQPPVNIVDVENSDSICMIFLKREEREKINHALELGGIQTKSVDSRNEISFSKDDMERLKRMSPDKISMLMRLSEKYDSILFNRYDDNKQKINDDKKAALKAAAEHLTGHKTKEDLKNVKEYQKWQPKLFFSFSETRDLLKAVNQVTSDKAKPLDERLARTPRKK